MPSTVPENMHIMKFRTSKELKNMILSINLAILTFLSLLSNFLKHFRVGRYENRFIFFLEGNKNCRVGTKKKKNMVGRVSGNTGIFFFFFFFFF